MLLRVENYLRIMFQAIWWKCILVMTRGAMLLAKMKCRSNWTGCYGKFDKVRHVAKLEKEFDFYWAVGDRWLCDNFSGDTWKISRWAMTIAHGKKYSTLNVTTDTYGPIVIAKGKEDLNLCHHRLDHMSSKRLKIMHLKWKLFKFKSSSHWHVWKLHTWEKKWVSFKKVSITRKEAKLKLVHTDVRGIDLISSISGRSYFVIFTYDHLRKVWVYLMR